MGKPGLCMIVAMFVIPFLMGCGDNKNTNEISNQETFIKNTWNEKLKVWFFNH